MIMFGIIVILIAALLGVLGFWLSTSDNTQLDLNAGGILHVQIAPITIWLLGAATVALLWLGMWMATHGTKRSVRNRRERKQLERDQKDQEAQLAATRARLDDERRRNADRMTDTGTTHTGTTYAGGADTGAHAETTRTVDPLSDRDRDRR